MSRFLERDRFHAEKLAWQHQVMCDTRLGAVAKLLGAFIMHYLDDKKGGSWTSQPFLAEHLGVDIRTVRRATTELVSLGHLSIEVSRGRGKANFYRALLQEPDHNAASMERAAGADQAEYARTERPDIAPEKRTPVSPYPNENRTTETLKPVSVVRPTLPEPYSPLSPRLARSPAATLEPMTSPRHGQHRSARQQQCGKLTDPRAFPEWRKFANGDVRSAVVRAIGEDGAKSYLDPAAWREGDSTIVCYRQIAAERLREGAGSFLAQLGVRIFYDHSASRIGRANNNAIAR